MVEAQSLAGVIDLADNPPVQYQEDIGPPLTSPLVLYIARVPGSRGMLV